MPALRNARHEKFAAHYGKTGNASESYRVAYGPKRTEAADAACASRLLTDAKVSLRVKEFQEKAATGTILNMTRRRELMYQFAHDEQAKHADRIAAIMGDAKLAGELIDKQAHTVDFVRPITIRLPGILTDVQAAAQRRKGLAQS